MNAVAYTRTLAIFAFCSRPAEQKALAYPILTSLTARGPLEPAKCTRDADGTPLPQCHGDVFDIFGHRGLVVEAVCAESPTALGRDYLRLGQSHGHLLSITRSINWQSPPAD